MPVTGLLLVTLLASSGFLFCGRGSWPVSFDWATQFFWSAQFSRALVEDSWYPRWVEPSDGGYGNPVFVYYPPAVFYLYGAIDNVLGSLPARNMAVTVFIVLFAGAAGMFALARRFYRDDRVAFQAAVLYTLAPGHIFFLHGDWLFANLAAMSAVPWVLWSLTGGRRRLFACFPPLAAILVCTHPPSALVYGAFAALTLLLQHFSSRRHTRPGSRRVSWNPSTAVLLSAVALLLSAPYLLPAVANTGLVRLDALSAPEWGKAAENLLFTVHNRRDNPGWKILNWILAAGVSFQMFALLLSGRVYSGSEDMCPVAAADVTDGGMPGGGRDENSSRQWSCTFIRPARWASLVFFLLSTELSYPLWRALPGLGGFLGCVPWRLTAPVTLVFAVCCAPVCALRGRVFERVAAFAPLGIGFLLVLAATRLGLPPSRVAEACSRPEWPVYEYRPRIAPDRPPADDQSLVSPVDTPTPGARVRVIRWTSEHRTVRWHSPTRGELRLRTYCFPGWRACLAPGPGPSRIAATRNKLGDPGSPDSSDADSRHGSIPVGVTSSTAPSDCSRHGGMPASRVLEPVADPSTGAQVFRGLPPGDWIVSVELGDVPLEKEARYLLFIGLVLYAILVLFSAEERLLPAK